MIDGLCFARRESVTLCVGLWCVGMGMGMGRVCVCVKERVLVGYMSVVRFYPFFFFFF